MFESIEDYQNIYYILIFIFFLIGGITRSFHNGKKHYVVYSIIILLSLFIGNRPMNVGSDTISYHYMFDVENSKSLTDSIDVGDPLFVLLLRLCSIFEDVYFCLKLISFIILLGTYLFAKKVCKEEKVGSSLLLFFSMISMDIFFNQQFNIIRTGLANIFIYFFFYTFYRKQYKTSLIYALVAVGFHLTMFIPIVVVLFMYYLILKERLCLFIYFLAITIAFMGYGIHSISDYLLGFDLRQIQSYLSENNFEYKVGFRNDFMIFNTFFLICFLYLRKYIKVKDNFFDDCIKYYMLLSAVFFLWFYIPFSDRIGAFSWNFIPVILYLGCCKSFPRKQKFYGIISFCVIYFVNIILFVI